MTDEEFKELLKKRYQVQLSYYKRALMQMTKRPVKEACIMLSQSDRQSLLTSKWQNDILLKLVKGVDENGQRRARTGQGQG